MKQAKQKQFLQSMIGFVVCMVLIITFSVLIECVFFQFPALRYKEKPVTFTFETEDAGETAGGTGGESAGEDEESVTTKQKLVKLTDDEVKAIEVERENAKLLAEYQGKEYVEPEDESLVIQDGIMYRKVYETELSISFPSPYYIHKLDLRAPVSSDCGYSVALVRNGAVADSDIYCSIEPKTGAGICTVSQLADALQIRILSREELMPSDITVTVSNSFRPNTMRMFFLISLFSLGAILWFFKKTLAEKPEWIFAIVCFGLGMLLICGIGTNQVSYDEYVHAKSAYKLSFGTTIESTETAIQMCGNLLPYFNNPEERALVEAYEDRNNDFSWADIGHQSRFVRTETRVYYPMAIGFWLGRTLHASFATTVALAKLGNLLFYILVVFFAIRLAKRYKYLVALIALLPNCVFLAAAITYDAIVNSFLLLGWVLVLNEMIEPEKKMTWQNLLVILFSFFIGCQSKPIYIVMVLMIVFFGRKKFENPVQEWILKVSVIVMAGLMLYNIFCPTPAAGSDYYLVGNFSFAGDKRNVGTSVTGQIQYIFSHPAAYTLLLLESMGGMLWGYLSGKANFFQYGYMGSAPTVFTYVVILLAAWIVLFAPRQERRVGIGVKYIVLNLIMILGTAAIIWTSMYASYTPVGADAISGVQGRYFIPLFLAFFSCFMNGKLESKLSGVGRGRLVFAVMALLNLYMIWNLVIRVINV